jgi:hypothetical protein
MLEMLVTLEMLARLVTLEMLATLVTLEMLVMLVTLAATKDAPLCLNLARVAQFKPTQGSPRDGRVLIVHGWPS